MEFEKTSLLHHVRLGYQSFNEDMLSIASKAINLEREQRGLYELHSLKALKAISLLFCHHPRAEQD